MNWFEEAAKILLGISITGMVSAIVWLFKWCDRTELLIHDLTRDVKHLGRQHMGLSDTVAKLDLKDEQIANWVRRDLISVDRRIGKIDLRIHVIEVRFPGPMPPVA